ncbi:MULTISPECIES: hypothetical protein, partial [Paraburkholderia]
EPHALAGAPYRASGFVLRPGADGPSRLKHMAGLERTAVSQDVKLGAGTNGVGFDVGMGGRFGDG